ncbi:MAG: bifunctional protein-serine/threonine kinase/phosphatase, partial [Burkholderia sp.]|nr:bifunctional protein-serine/threonine kinase/phosphatase [Burkholderia sp.]
EFLLALERGASRPLQAPAPTPLARRDPAMVWRAVAAVSIVINVLLMYLVAVR